MITKTLKDNFSLDGLNYHEVDSRWNSDVYLFQKWAYRVPKGWYGFALGKVPFEWGKIIDAFLTEVEQIDPNFEILQVKVKFGGLRCYLKLSDTLPPETKSRLQEETSELESWLYSKELVY